MERWDVIVVGAGAAGLMSGITAAERGARVLVLDGKEKIGAKILVAGGGRCNVTNDFMDATCFHGGARKVVERTLAAFDREATLGFFAAIGAPLTLEPEMGKYFPVSNSARTVLNALLGALADAGAELRTGRPVTDIAPGEAWQVTTEGDSHRAEAVVLCTGGLALPKSGSTGAGYAFTSRLGHTITRTTPALSPLLAHPAVHADLSGITIPVRLDWREGQRRLASYAGSFLFTHTGYSGPAALNLSRHVAQGRAAHPKATVVLRLLPDVEDGEEGRFWDALVRSSSRRGVGQALTARLPRRVAEMVCRVARVSPVEPVGRITAEPRRRLLAALLDQRLPVDEVAGYTRAEATAGGVALDEVEPATMMSRLAPGLFLAGEILDVDGQLGGYNFQWAWSSGVVAGRSAARWSLARRTPTSMHATPGGRTGT